MLRSFLFEHKHIKFLGCILNRYPVHKGYIIIFLEHEAGEATFWLILFLEKKKVIWWSYMWSLKYLYGKWGRWNLYFRFFHTFPYIKLYVFVEVTFDFSPSLSWRFPPLESNGMYGNYSFLTDSMRCKGGWVRTVFVDCWIHLIYPEWCCLFWCLTLSFLQNTIPCIYCFSSCASINFLLMQKLWQRNYVLQKLWQRIPPIQPLEGRDFNPVLGAWERAIESFSNICL